MLKFQSFLFRVLETLKLKKSNDNLLKIYLDLDFQFYNVDLDNLKDINIIYDEQELYDENVAGITTFLKFQKANLKDYEFYPDIDFSKLNVNQKYAVVTYKYERIIYTKTVATI